MTANPGQLGTSSGVLIACLGLIVGQAQAATHHSGADCLSCHTDFKLAGTVFANSERISTLSGVRLQPINNQSGALLSSNSAGNMAAADVPAESCLLRLGNRSSKTWHAIPQQGSCNTCHEPDRHASAVRTVRMLVIHTSIPSDNGRSYCHCFPASTAYEQLQTPGVL